MGYQTTTLKKPIPLKVPLIIGLAFVATLLAMFQLLGWIDLSFIPNGFLGIFVWASENVFSAVEITIAWTVVVVFGTWFWSKRKYWKGEKAIVVNAAASGANLQNQLKDNVFANQPKKEEVAST